MQIQILNLVAVTKVSKILWPYVSFGSELPAETSTRREGLRNLLSLEESSPLKSRTDFDIEEWAAKSKDRCLLIPTSVLQIWAGIAPGPIAYMHNFDQSNLSRRRILVREEIKALNELLQKIKGSYS
ncbi:MAG: hypothetical protein WAM14_09480 [Candidatus Nitrosopolaris sp.]